MRRATFFIVAIAACDPSSSSPVDGPELEQRCRVAVGTNPCLDVAAWRRDLCGSLQSGFGTACAEKLARLAGIDDAAAQAGIRMAEACGSDEPDGCEALAVECMGFGGAPSAAAGKCLFWEDPGIGTCSNYDACGDALQQVDPCWELYPGGRVECN